MTEEDEAFNDIERKAKQRMEAVRAAMLRGEDDDIQDYKRPWVGLTDEEVDQLAIDAGIITWIKRVYDDVDKKFYDLPLGEGMEGDGISLKQFASLISKKLKEKNL
jgi:hypothetical protein